MQPRMMRATIAFIPSPDVIDDPGGLYQVRVNVYVRTESGFKTLEPQEFTIGRDKNAFSINVPDRAMVNVRIAAFNGLGLMSSSTFLEFQAGVTRPPQPVAAMSLASIGPDDDGGIVQPTIKQTDGQSCGEACECPTEGGGT